MKTQLSATPTAWSETEYNKPVLLAGLIGRGIQRSRTPEMHMSEAEAQGMRAVYKILDFDTMKLRASALGDVIQAAELAGYDGLNVTYPFKMEAIGHLDELSEEASALGSVNTIRFRDGRRYGENTDLWGFRQSFSQGMRGSPRERVLLIGAGGAGVAVAHALADCDVSELFVFDSDHIRSARLAAQLNANRPQIKVTIADTLDVPDLRKVDGIVNATPVGMAKLPGMPIPPDFLSPSMWVADIIYFPLETELLACARLMGCRVLPGSGMAIHQAARAFEIFTGRLADRERMKGRFDAFDRS